MGLKVGGLRGSLRNINTGVGAIPDSGLSRWTFDNEDTENGTALDSWGDNDGAINGATTGVSGANQTYTTNEAYSFDGTDDNVNIGDTLPHGVTGETISAAAWINGDDYSSRHAVIGSGDNWVVQIENGEVYLRTSGGNNGGDGSNLSTGTWHHVVVTWDAGTNGVTYVDGSQTDDTSFGDTSDVNENFFIGDVTDSPFAGDIDDIRVYNKILSSTEVSNLYNTGSISG